MAVSVNVNSSNSVSLSTTTANTVTVNSRGASSDAHFEHVQSSASDQWDITHNLGKKPAVSIHDSNGYEVFGVVHHMSLNRVIIEFKVPTFGKAYFN